MNKLEAYLSAPNQWG